MTINTLTPSCPHPMGRPLAITMTDGTEQKIAVTGYANQHSPTGGIGVRHMWMRTFDREGGKIPPAGWRTNINRSNDA